jgi:site-specific recombinase XerD
MLLAKNANWCSLNRLSGALPVIFIDKKELQSPRIKRGVLFTDWSTKEKIELTDLCIEQIDRFQAEITSRFAPETRRRHRSVLRGLLTWLYQQKIIRRDLARLLVGAPQYAQARPPRFLRQEEIQKLFSIRPQTSSEHRTWAMLHLAFFLGLRPREISLITLDDIRFSKQEITLPQRKSLNPISVPLPDAAIKAVADYIIGTRPETGKRALFLRLLPPYEPVTGPLVSRNITAWMRKAGTPGSSCGTHMPRTCWRPAPPYLKSKKCLAMTGFRPRTVISEYTPK